MKSTETKTNTPAVKKNAASKKLAKRNKQMEGLIKELKKLAKNPITVVLPQ